MILLKTSRIYIFSELFMARMLQVMKKKDGKVVCKHLELYVNFLLHV